MTFGVSQMLKETLYVFSKERKVGKFQDEKLANV
jgi:hypothetical protein